MTTISPRELAALLKQDPSLPMVDVRTEEEFAEGHIPGAVCIPLDGFEPRPLAESGHLPVSEPVYILCRSGKRATTAAERIRGEGFTNPVVLVGGTLAWIEAGFAVVGGGKALSSGNKATR